MDNYVAIFFESDAQAFKGLQALWKLNRSSDLRVHAAAVIRRDTAGQIYVTKNQSDAGIRTAIGLTVGLVAGMIAGPAGLAVGAFAGATAGVGGDVIKSGERREAVDEVEQHLAPGRAAVVAEVSEDQGSLVDPTMRALGGLVYRRPKDKIRHAFFDLDDVDRVRLKEES